MLRNFSFQELNTALRQGLRSQTAGKGKLIGVVTGKLHSTGKKRSCQLLVSPWSVNRFKCSDKSRWSTAVGVSPRCPSNAHRNRMQTHQVYAFPANCQYRILQSGLVLFTLKTIKFSRFLVTSNLVAYAWNIKYKRKQKLITQFSCKSRDKSFDPS